LTRGTLKEPLKNLKEP